MGIRRLPLPVLWMAACSSKSPVVEDARSIKPLTRDAGAPPSTAPARVEAQLGQGDVQIRVEWKDVPAAARASNARTPCGSPAVPAVSPTTTWGIPEALAIVGVRTPPSESGAGIGGNESRVVFDGCAFSHRIVIARTALVVASASFAPEALSFTPTPVPRSVATGSAVPVGSLPIHLSVIGHELEIPLAKDTVYVLGAGSEAATVVAAPTPYYGVTEANGQVVLRGIPTGDHPVTAWIPARSGQPARLAAGTVTVRANELAEVTIDMSRSL